MDDSFIGYERGKEDPELLRKQQENSELTPAGETAKSIEERFEQFEEEDDFEMVANKLSLLRDLHVFLRLAQWFPTPACGLVVVGAEHDQIWLFPEEEQLETLTDEQIVELCRCGLFYDEDCGYLSKFV